MKTTGKKGNGKKQMQQDRAMSLIELLVALGIVAILAALLTGASQNIFGNSKSTACLANLRQIGFAILQYSNDHNGYLPTPGGSADTNAAAAWPQALMDYDISMTKKSRVLICPADPDPAKTRNGYSYAMNGNLNASLDTKTGTYQPLRMITIPKPAQIILFADSIASKNGRSVGQSTVQFLHGKKSNVLFLDGHTSTLPQSEATNSMYWKVNPS